MGKIILVVIALILLMPTPTDVDAARREVCRSMDKELATFGIYSADPDYEWAMNWVGCNPDTLQRAGGMCPRYAYRTARSFLYREGFMIPNLEEIAERTEAQYSRGHRCVQYEDGGYGFPDKQIDCAVDPRC